MEAEIWRPVVGEPEYEVSNLGRVRSLDAYRTTMRRGRVNGILHEVTKLHRGKILRPGTSSTGRLSVNLAHRGSQTVHKLVLEAFSGPCPPGMEALHQDDDFTNNAATNLQWGTRLKNVRDAFKNGLHPLGENRWAAKLIDKDVLKIIDLLQTESTKKIGLKFGVNESTIRQIRNGVTWRHVTGFKRTRPPSPAQTPKSLRQASTLQEASQP